MTNCIISWIPRLIVNRKNRIGVIIPESWRVWTVRELVRKARVVLTIRKVCHSEPEEGSDRHIMPVICRQYVKYRSGNQRLFLHTAVVHCAGNGDKRSTTEWNKRDPCFGLRSAVASSECPERPNLDHTHSMSPPVKQVEFPSKVERQESQTSKRY